MEELVLLLTFPLLAFAWLVLRDKDVKRQRRHASMRPRRATGGREG